MRSHPHVALLLACVACRRGGAPPSEGLDLEAEGVLLPGASDAGAPPGCRVLSRHRAMDGARVDAGESAGPAYEALRVALDGRRRRLLWVDARTSQLVLGGDGSAARHARSLGPGERSDPAFALLDAVGPAVVWVRDAPASRRHVVRVGERFERGCQSPETRDEGLSISAAATPRGLITAWDDDGPRPAAGSIKVQLIAPSALREGERDDALPLCATPTQVSPPEQDASDPVLAPTPEGGAMLVWLTARDIDATQSNDTVTDVWAIALGADARAVGLPLRLTNAPGHRFGVSAASGERGSAWVAFRVADETDSESRGDGGAVEVLRVERGPEGLRRASDPRAITEAGLTPTGAPQVFARGSVAMVFLRHRQGHAVSAYARALRHRSGAVEMGALRREPALRGELPAALDAQGAVHVLASAPDGALDTLRVRCEATP